MHKQPARLRIARERLCATGAVDARRDRSELVVPIVDRHVTLPDAVAMSGD